eukprot:CAMPEP_0113943202 /NCGR_PEP_ID=MMETSP1339-20121228/20505_1 /TAXON_ID=94617 /ORGANISM="Fibrocapsa japonica" /LENGTH=157 /DNA_ID=CAMNT_0000948007 /DNA_START=55 /DNA_END=528 /DNA_ORIENTATION=- /assembly_acc=CAM_ASM_000762
MKASALALLFLLQSLSFIQAAEILGFANTKQLKLKINEVKVQGNGDGDGDGVPRKPPKVYPENMPLHDLWKLQRKALIRIGSKGVGNGHKSSIASMVAAHPVVKVKVNQNHPDLDQIAAEMIGSKGSEIVVLDKKQMDKQKLILFSSPKFVESNPHL